MLLDYIKDENIIYQLVPPHMHQQNLAEQAIQTFKSHFIAMMCGCDPSFPLHLWCRLLPQAEITMNLLCTSHINPNLSAYAQIHGQIDYIKRPLSHQAQALLSLRMRPNKVCMDHMAPMAGTWAHPWNTIAVIGVISLPQVVNRPLKPVEFSYTSANPRFVIA